MDTLHSLINPTMGRRAVLVGGMAVLAANLFPSVPAVARAETSLRAAAAGRGLTFGMAMNRWNLLDERQRQFTARAADMIVPTTEMKMGVNQPTPDSFDFAMADRLAAFAKEQNLSMRGHTMVWHRNLPSWAPAAIADNWHGELERRIKSVASRWPVTQWDVCNEVVSDEGGQWRTDSAWYQGCGSIDYVRQAFLLARAHVAPGTKLAYCDFGTEAGAWAPRRRVKILEVLEMLASEGLVDVFAAQCHLTVFEDGYRYDETAWRKFLEQVKSLGIEVVLSEIDVTAQIAIQPDELARRSAEITGLVIQPWLDLRMGDQLVTWGLRNGLVTAPEPFSHLPQSPLAFDEHFQLSAMGRAMRDQLLAG